MQSEKHIFPKFQLDSQGYTPSFDLETSSKEQISAFYHKYGFVIYRNVISQEDINKSIDQLWNQMIQYWKYATDKVIDRNDPKTWDHIKSMSKMYGFASDDILTKSQFWINRKNAKVYSSFKKTYEAQTGKPLTEPLLACLDRGSMMRPSKLNQDWRTIDCHHFDIDPWLWVGQREKKYRKYDYDFDSYFLMMGEGNFEENVGYTKLAGVLALSDTNEKSGGFQCVCGFQNYIKQWCQENPTYIHITQDQNLVDNFQKVFLKTGSLLVFSRQLPHNIYQNDSENFRYAQYLRMTPESALVLDQEQKKARKKLIKHLLPKQLDLSDPISKEVFMLD